ncbi:ATP-binding protein [Paenibacillus sp. PAMC21692]|uniref:ATP-binding protein n=1 Tax=Paenibacillus sp. PAMC21692 TaxID=2762320 RepID=UPI00164CF30F|nr:ATP-binding protein [Paenibacillus sp. PAMC21692]QNK59138.1 PDZ domain-containing protein [Paenibacillus sp. PAMC21692]
MKSTAMKRLSAFLFLIFFVTITIYLTAVIIRVPSIGAYVLPQDNAGFFVVSLAPGGQAKMNGLQIGDRVLEINGKQANEFPNLLKYDSLEDADNVLIERRGSSIISITFAKAWSGEHTTLELLLQLYIPGISLFVFCAFSAFLYVKRNHDPAAIMLILFFSSIGISYYSSSASILRDPVGLSIIYVVLPTIPLLYMSFMNIYLRRFDASLIDKRWLVVLFGIVGAVSASSLIYIWTDLLSNETFNYIKNAYSAIVLVGNLVCVYKLVLKYMKHRFTKLHSLFTITLTAHLVAFTPFAALNLLPQLFGNDQVLPPAFTALFLFVLPIVYFYLSTSNQLFDIDFILTRFKYYTALSLLPALLLAAVVTLAAQAPDGSAWSKFIGSFVIVYVGMTLFLYAKEQIDQRFRPRLFKAMYSYQDSLDRFSRNVAKVMKQGDLESVLKNEINQLLPVGRITFLIVDQSEHAVFPMSDEHEEMVTADFLLGTVNAFKLGDLIDLPYGLGLVIGKQRSRYHVLWIGMKTNHTKFNSDEIRWLKTMANYSSIVFENLYLIEGLIEDLQSEVRKEHAPSPWVLRMLFLLSENERRKLAADLHDSALQDQLLWYRRLESIMMDHPLSEKLGNELEAIKEGLLDVIHQIRETCNELRPPLLKEMGVVEAVESIIEHTQMRVNFEVKFRSKPIQHELNEEQITAIYRIVQELLRNADKHADAKVITLELELRKDMLYFRYQDDGIGMDVEGMAESFEHMGLSGIKERVASLDGEISFVSERGRGLEVTILMPVMIEGARTERGITGDSYLIS